MAELFQLGAVEQVHRLQQRRSLAPRTAGIERDVAERGRDRLVEAGAIVGEVFGGEDAAVLLLIFDDRARDVAAIERVARCGEAGFASARARRRLLVRHVLQRGAERLLHEHLADLRRASVRQVEIDVRRELAILRLMIGDDLVHEVVGGESVARVADRGFRHLAEAHGAEALERRDPGIGRRRHHRAHDALRDFAAVVLHEVVGIERLRPGAETGNGDEAVLGGGIDDDRRDARDVHEFRLHDTERDSRRNALRRSRCRRPPES